MKNRSVTLLIVRQKSQLMRGEASRIGFSGGDLNSKIQSRKEEQQIGGSKSMKVGIFHKKIPPFSGFVARNDHQRGDARTVHMDHRQVTNEPVRHLTDFSIIKKNLVEEITVIKSDK